MHTKEERGLEADLARTAPGERRDSLLLSFVTWHACTCGSQTLAFTVLASESPRLYVRCRCGAGASVPLEADDLKVA